jgi:hypothetical protein
MANPSNHLPPYYDDIQPSFQYDPTFTETISHNMRVPHKLGAVNGMEPTDDFNIGMPPVSQAASMMVPERIMLAGQDQHIGMKEDLRLDLDPVNQHFNREFVGLSTPPRILTLDERPFPSLENDKEDFRNVQNGYLPVTPKGQSSSLAYDLLATPGDGLLLQDDDDADDITVLSRQVMKLSRHVVRLEEENARRSQRELFLYPIVIGYILLQVAKRILGTN